MGKADEMRLLSVSNFDEELLSKMKEECLTFIKWRAEKGERNYRYCRTATREHFEKLAIYLGKEGFDVDIVYPYPNPKGPAIDIEW